MALIHFEFESEFTGHNEDVYIIMPDKKRNQTPAEFYGNGKKYPAGNAHVVYIGDYGPWYSVRGHLQRAGAQDYELFCMLKDRGTAVGIIEKVCRTFDDYDGDAMVFDEARRELLETLG